MTLQRSEQSHYSTIFLPDTHSITVDGDLSDWNAIAAATEPIRNWQRISGEWVRDPFVLGAYHGPEDFSASFRAYADAAYLYITVHVTDDDVISGIGDFKQDDISIYLDGDAGKPGIYELGENNQYDWNDSEIIVYRDVDGEVELRGRVSVFDEIPYLWDALGVKAAVKDTDDGYVAEVMIPREVLGISEFTDGTEFGFTIVVRDVDRIRPGQNRLCWSKDPYRICERDTGVFGVMYLRSDQKKRVTSPQVSSTVSTHQVPLRTKETGKHITLDALHRLDLHKAQELYVQIRQEARDGRDRIWAACVLAKIAEKEQQCETVYSVMKDAVSSSNTTGVIHKRLAILLMQAQLLADPESLTQDVIDDYIGILNSNIGVAHHMGVVSQSLEFHGDYKHAVQVRNTILGFVDVKLGAQEHRIIGRMLLRSKNEDRAIPHLETALQQFDADSNYYYVIVTGYHLGNAYKATKQLDKAIACWEHALATFEHIEDTIQERGFTFMESWRYSTQKALDGAKRLRDTHGDEYLAEPYKEKGERGTFKKGEE